MSQQEKEEIIGLIEYLGMAVDDLKYGKNDNDLHWGISWHSKLERVKKILGL